MLNIISYVFMGFVIGLACFPYLKKWLGSKSFSANEKKATGISKGTMYIDYNICGYAILIAPEDIVESADRVQIAEYGTPLYDDLYSKCRFTTISAFEKDIQARQRIKRMAEELSTLLDKNGGT